MSNEDLQLARILLGGFVEDRQGRLSSEYLKKGSADELRARKALARLLRDRGPLDRQLREHLADLFDPPKGERRKIQIVGHGQGRPSNHVRDTQIASHVDAEMRRGKRYEDAIATAADKFCLSGDMIKKIWGRYRADRTLLGGDNDPPPNGSQSGT
jgi:hypothetical protein